MTDGFMEPHPLWEYPSYPISDVYEIFSLEFQNDSTELVYERSFDLDLINEGLLNGVAIWNAFEFDKDNTIDTGLLEKPIKNKHLIWSRDFKQAVHILETKTHINENASKKLSCKIRFEIQKGDFSIQFTTN